MGRPARPSGHRFARPARRASLFAAMALLALGADTPRRGAVEISPWVRELPGGVTVELLGIGDPEADPVVWWSPDRKRIEAPLENSLLVGRTRGGEQVRCFAGRVDGPSSDDLVIRWNFGDHGGESGTAFKDGRPLPGVEFAGTALPQEAETWTIRMEFAAAAWETAATWTPDGGVESVPEGRSVMFSRPRAVREGIAIVVVEDYPGRREARVAALDRNGNVLSATRGGQGWRTEAFKLHDDVMWPPITPEEVDRYALQFRPIQSVEFRDVPLKAPGT